MQLCNNTSVLWRYHRKLLFLNRNQDFSRTLFTAWDAVQIQFNGPHPKFKLICNAGSRYTPPRNISSVTFHPGGMFPPEKT